MMEFRIKPHSLRPGGQMVEVWIDGVFVAGIYPSAGSNVRHEPRTAIKVVSKHFEDYCYYVEDHANDEPGAINLLLDLSQ
jgi:hypothetical protein